MLNQVWEAIFPQMNWVVFLLVISVGYFITKTAVFKNWKWNTTFKILAISAPISIIYYCLSDADAGSSFASFCLAFGFHAVILKPLESIIKSIGGGGVSDPTGKSIGGGGVSEPTK